MNDNIRTENEYNITNDVSIRRNVCYVCKGTINNNNAYYELTVPGKLICGGITAVVAQTITYPLDVVRRHMQLVTMFKDSAIRQYINIIKY